MAEEGGLELLYMEHVIRNLNWFYINKTVFICVSSDEWEKAGKVCVVIFVKNIARTTITYRHLFVVSLLLLRSAVSAGHTNLMSLVHRLLPVVQLFIQVTFLFTEQILDDRTQTSEVIVVREASAAGNQTSNLLCLYQTPSSASPVLFFCWCPHTPDLGLGPLRHWSCR